MTSTTTTHATRGLTALVTDLDRAVRGAAPGRATVDAVAGALRPALGDPQLLRPDQRVGDPAAYRQHLLHVADDGAFSLVALVWLPGQATPIHDHLAWCVVGVHEGAEHETRYTARPDGRAGPDGVGRGATPVTWTGCCRPATSTASPTPARTSRSRCTSTEPT